MRKRIIIIINQMLIIIEIYTNTTFKFIVHLTNINLNIDLNINLNKKIFL